MTKDRALEIISKPHSVKIYYATDVDAQGWQEAIDICKDLLKREVMAPRPNLKCGTMICRHCGRTIFDCDDFCCHCGAKVKRAGD